ncbi:MAG: hypothetical protein OXC63_12050 [Aestuariivita sp.]|nr:hypothetical protein [Aestuariivita sp.]MCY4347799.1 hypothetical protein [Aestuariivita sp.]
MTKKPHALFPIFLCKGVASVTNRLSTVCTTDGLVDYRFEGGDNAMIHLEKYSSGGQYQVEQISPAEVAETTQDCTPFACVQRSESNQVEKVLSELLG